MKNLILVLIMMLTSIIYAQNKKREIDTTAIAFKAKLFTVSEYGISNKKTILKHIESQKVSYLKSIYKNFIFMKIDFEQPYVINNGNTRTLLRDCGYYMAYNSINCKYYRLGGFDSVDVDSFIKDLENLETKVMTDLEDKEIEGMSLQCLYDYSQLEEKEKTMQNFKCFDQCSKNTSLYYSDYNKK